MKIIDALANVLYWTAIVAACLFASMWFGNVLRWPLVWAGVTCFLMIRWSHRKKPAVTRIADLSLGAQTKPSEKSD